VNLTHVRLLVDNFPEVFRFYRDTLALPVRMGVEDGVYAEFDAGNATIGLYGRDMMEAAIGDVGRPDPVGVADRVALTFEVPSVDQSYDALRKRGIDFVAEPTDRKEWFLRTAHFRDPAGNLIEIYENMTGEE
jgi:lactoylglutathione lyase